MLSDIRKCAGSDVFFRDHEATSKPTDVLSTTSGYSLGGILTESATDYAYLPGFMGIFMAIRPLIGPPMSTAVTQAMATSCRGCSGRALGRGRGGGAAAGGAPGSGSLASGGMAGMGQAASVGALAVPQSWGWAARLRRRCWAACRCVGVAGRRSGATGGLPLHRATDDGRAAAGRRGGCRSGRGRCSCSKYVPRLKRGGALARGRIPDDEYAPAGAGRPAARSRYTPHIVYLPNNGHTAMDTTAMDTTATTGATDTTGMGSTDSDGTRAICSFRSTTADASGSVTARREICLLVL